YWLQKGEEVRCRPSSFRSGPLRKPRHRLSPLTPSSVRVQMSQNTNRPSPTPSDLLTFQPTQLFVPTLSLHGKEEKNDALYLHSQPRTPRVCGPSHNCFNSKGFPTVSALLHLFRIASSYQPGYNPLFIYNFTSPPPNFFVGDAVPASVVLPGAPGVVSLKGKRLSQAAFNTVWAHYSCARGRA
ncbi:hypothetical protein B0H14DRAFT_2825329, partial [Mycena olivaceomarginata]